MELTPRLRAVAALVPQGAAFADIGTDHAYLPAWLLTRGVIDRAIAADLRDGPLQRARETAQKYVVADRMDFRLCDGLTGLHSGEADTIAIAGMGGDTIAHILAQAPWTRSAGITLILQPMSSQPDLRQWLQKNGYCIQKETIAREGEKLYTILLVESGRMDALSPAELWAGRQSNDPLRREWLDHVAEKVQKALTGQRAAARPDEAALAQLTEILDGLRAMKEEWNAWQR